MNSCEICGRSLMDRTEASDAFNAGSIPVGRSFGSRNRGFRELFCCCFAASGFSLGKS